MDERMRLGIIRVLTPANPDPVWLNSHGRIIERLHPDVGTITRCIPGQPQGIFDEASQKMAEPKIMHLAEEVEGLGVDGILISCSADPAVEKIRIKAKVPVVGAGRPAALLALSYGQQPVGVLGLQDTPPESIRAVLGDRRCGGTKPEGVITANDLYRPGAKDSFVAAAQELRDGGAQAIVLACTGFSPLDIAAMLSRRLGVPVVDPVAAAGCFIRFMMVAEGTQG